MYYCIEVLWHTKKTCKTQSLLPKCTPSQIEHEIPKKNGRLGSDDFPHILPPLTNHPNPFFVLSRFNFQRKKKKKHRGTVAWRIRVPEIPRRPSQCQQLDLPTSGVIWVIRNGWLKRMAVKDEQTWDVGCHPGIPRKKNLYLVPESKIIQDLSGTKSVYFLVCTSLSTRFWGVEWFDVF